jgi:DNA polymerase I-like protein with 3'-5' exonuclease and polymerase domains
MDLVPKETMLPYAGGDTDANLRVANAMKKELLADPHLTAFYVNILHPANRAFEMIERGGVLVDLEAYKELQADLEAEIDQCMVRAKKALGGRIVAKHWDSSKRGGLNLKKASLICDFMFSPMGLNLKPKMFTDKSKEPSTSSDHIKMFADVPDAKEFVEAFTEFGSADKMLSTYVGDGKTKGFLKHLRSDGRFHPTYFLFAGKKEEDEGGTNTGRLSAKNPAFQVIPKHGKWAKKIRRCFPAPPGYLVMERDYSQGELRVVACIANESNMIAAYRAGRDLHAETAGPFRGYDYDHMMELKILDKVLFDAIRQLGKAGNFGLLYGMGVEGFMDYAWLNYGVKLTYQEAFEFREAFFKRYPGLLEYHRVYKEFARKHGYVRGPQGRIRHLPLIKSPIRELASKAERQACNSPVQGCLSDMLLWSLGMEHETGLTKVCPSFGSCHDAGYNYVPEDKNVELARQHVEIMENLPFEKVFWKPQLKFIADAKLGPNMAEMKEVK